MHLLWIIKFFCICLYKALCVCVCTHIPTHACVHDNTVTMALAAEVKHWISFLQAQLTAVWHTYNMSVPPYWSSSQPVFLCCSKLHVFRAVEPALKHRYKHFNCLASSPPVLYQRCLDRRSRGLATRSQLAKLVFEHQEKAAAAGQSAFKTF